MVVVVASAIGLSSSSSDGKVAPSGGDLVLAVDGA
jgi:hypothetical protein